MERLLQLLMMEHKVLKVKLAQLGHRVNKVPQELAVLTVLMVQMVLLLL